MINLLLVKKFNFKKRIFKIIFLIQYQLIGARSPACHCSGCCLKLSCCLLAVKAGAASLVAEQLCFKLSTTLHHA